MAATVRLDMTGHVATVTLSRPDRGNAISLEMFEELSTLGRALRREQSLRAVVLCGAGEHFCSGIDTSVFSDADPSVLLERMQPLAESPANFFQHIAWVWRELPVPVIAALHGAVFGGGLQLAMGADVRIAAPATRCSVMEIRWGIIPDMALTATMRDTVRLDVLRELVYTGRIVDADEAQAIGLLTRIDADPRAAAERLAADIAGRSPDAVRRAKSLMQHGFDLDVDAALRREAELQLTLLGGANQREAVIANVEKREPRFSDAVEAHEPSGRRRVARD